jgi:hypothetical protein
VAPDALVWGRPGTLDASSFEHAQSIQDNGFGESIKDQGLQRTDSHKGGIAEEEVSLLDELKAQARLRARKRSTSFGDCGTATSDLVTFDSPRDSSNEDTRRAAEAVRRTSSVAAEANETDGNVLHHDDKNCVGF